MNVDYLLVWAKNKSGNDQIQCFIVKKGALGLTISEQKSTDNYRVVQDAHFVLNNVVVSENDHLCKATSFESSTTDILKRFWIQTAWMATGMAAGSL